MTPAARALAWFKARGIRAAVVERWNAYARVRQDLFAFIDIVALVPESFMVDWDVSDYPPERVIMGVQVTSGANHAARRQKIMGLPAAKDWRAAGGRIWVMSFSKAGARGKRKMWTPRIEEVTP